VNTLSVFAGAADFAKQLLKVLKLLMLVLPLALDIERQEPLP
jgi:hypothetical protein